MLLVGADLLVRGSSKLAALARISPLVIGLTVVSAGTSAPEVAISVNASLTDRPDLALGNIVGSNIVNVLLVLGLSAIVAPLIVQARLIRFDVPVMVALSVAVLILSMDGVLSRAECFSLLVILVIYIFILVVGSRREASALAAAEPLVENDLMPRSRRDITLSSVFVVSGLGALVIGSRWLIESATTTAEYLGVSELVIGLTVVAAGTSLPEVATSVIAAFKGERDLAVGNVIGSCIFNLLLVLGLSGIVTASGMPVAAAVRTFDLPVMTAVAIACLPIFFTGRLIARWEGFVFLGYYVAYMAYVVLNATDHDALTSYTTGMIFFVIPITILTMMVLLIQSIRAGERFPGRSSFR